MKNKIKKAWEDRSSKYEDDPRGVLPKSFPKLSMDFLDNWMYTQIAAQIPKNKKIKILDLGCGYGRLAEKIEDIFPKTIVDGIDISENYVKLYNNHVSRGKAVAGDIVKLPFKSNSYDLIIVVTTLMYLTNKSDQQQAVNEIFRVLKSGGKAVFIERNYWGHQFIMLGGLVEKLRGHKNKEINAVSFKKDELKSLIKMQKGKIISQNGNTLFCLTIHLQYLLNFLPNPFLVIFLHGVNNIEKWGKFNLTLPLYFSYTAFKK